MGQIYNASVLDPVMAGCCQVAKTQRALMGRHCNFVCTSCIVMNYFEETNKHLYILSFHVAEMIEVVEICYHGKQGIYYSALLIPWLLMTWRRYERRQVIGNHGINPVLWGHSVLCTRWRIWVNIFQKSTRTYTLDSDSDNGSFNINTTRFAPMACSVR